MDVGQRATLGPNRRAADASEPAAERRRMISADETAARMRTAAEHEQRILRRLVGAGWAAYPFGQAQLPTVCRDQLCRFEDGARRPSLLRWLPDLIAFRTVGRRTLVHLVDAKCAIDDTPNYAIAMSAVEAAEVLTDRFYTPTFFVFDDWGVVTPRDARQRGVPGPAPRDGRGSGTPYLLIRKCHARPFDQIFPSVKPQADPND